MTDETFSQLIKTKFKQEITAFCQQWQISELALFGSVLRQDFGPHSDIDVLVSFAPEADWGLFDHVQMQTDLEAIFQRKVDLISKRAVEQSRNWLHREEILQTAQIIFSTTEAIHARG